MNLIHRSINGESILFNNEGVKIADCSDSVFLTNEEIARTTSPLALFGWTRTEAIPFAAPEMREADAFDESEFGTTNSYGKEVDIWALGLLAYELATGTIPDANDEQVLKLLEEQNYGEIFKLPSGSRSIEYSTFMERCLQVDPSERPTVQEIIKDTFMLVSQQYQAQWKDDYNHFIE